MSDALADGLNLTITGTVGAFGSIVGVPVNLALGVSVADGSPAAVDVADVSAPGVPVAAEMLVEVDAGPAVSRVAATAGSLVSAAVAAGAALDGGVTLDAEAALSPAL
jgi:hypothetical protein